MFITILGIKPRYLIYFNPTAYCLLPTAYSQGNVAILLRNDITYFWLDIVEEDISAVGVIFWWLLTILIFIPIDIGKKIEA